MAGLGVEEYAETIHHFSPNERTAPTPVWMVAIRASLAPDFRSATDAIVLPKAKPWAMREHFVMSSIRSREVGRSQRSGVRVCKDALKALDFSNSLLGVHSVSISNMSVAVVKRSGKCTKCTSCLRLVICVQRFLGKRKAQFSRNFPAGSRAARVPLKGFSA